MNKQILLLTLFSVAALQASSSIPAPLLALQDLQQDVLHYPLPPIDNDLLEDFEQLSKWQQTYGNSILCDDNSPILLALCKTIVASIPSHPLTTNTRFTFKVANATHGSAPVSVVNCFMANTVVLEKTMRLNLWSSDPLHVIAQRHPDATFNELQICIADSAKALSGVELSFLIARALLQNSDGVQQNNGVQEASRKWLGSHLAALFSSPASDAFRHQSDLDKRAAMVSKDCYLGALAYTARLAQASVRASLQDGHQMPSRPESLLAQRFMQLKDLLSRK